MATGSASGVSDEEILDPGVPIIDPHQHLWSLPDSFFAAIGSPSPWAYQRYLLEDYLADAATGHDIRATVYMEADPMRPMYRATGPEEERPVGEVEFANGIAAMAESGVFGEVRVAAAIVGHTRLENDPATVARVLAAHRRAGGHRFAGIRQPTISSQVPRLYLDERFRRGFRVLAAEGLSFDALVWVSELPDVVDLARAFPETTIVLDHLGSPTSGDFDDWRRLVRHVAECPNVVVKVGGLGMAHVAPDARSPFDSEQLAATWRPYVETCIEAFGVERSMFEGNFPMDSETCDYRTLWNAFKRLAAGASASEKGALFHDTAARAYRIAPLPPSRNPLVE